MDMLFTFSSIFELFKDRAQRAHRLNGSSSLTAFTSTIDTRKAFTSTIDTRNYAKITFHEKFKIK